MKFTLFNSVLIRKPLEQWGLVKDLVDDSEIIGFFRDYARKTALSISSKSLYDVYTKNDSSGGEHSFNRREIKALTRYAIRMSSRSTPFGLLATCNLGEWGAETRLISHGEIDISVSLDFGIKQKILESLLANEELLELLYFFPNSTLYEFNCEEYKYVERVNINGVAKCQLVSIKRTELIEEILEMSKNGITGIQIKSQIENFAKSKNQIASFYWRLMNSQLLVCEIELNVTGEDWLDRVNKILQSRIPLNAVILRNESLFISKLQEQVSECRFGNVLNVSDKIENDLTKRGIPNNGHNILYINSFRNSFDSISKELGVQIIKIINVLSDFSKRSVIPEMEQFKRKFKLKFGSQTVPLSIAIDPEIGLGYGNKNYHSGDVSSFLEDIEFQVETADSIPEESDEFTLFLHRKLLESCKSGHQTIELKSADLDKFRNKESVTNYASTYALMMSATVDFDGAIRNLAIDGAFGFCARFLGRFGVGNKNVQDLINLVSEVDRMQAPDGLLVEIVHVPSHYRDGNIITRSHNSEFEIPYLCHSTLPKKNQIHASDLYVSVVDDKVLIFHPELGQIQPTMSSAHNSSKDFLPVYKFLNDLSKSAVVGFLGFEWGGGMSGFKYPHLPRVELDGIVVWKASWTIVYEQIQMLINSAKEGLDVLRVVMKDLGIPMMFSINEADNFLVINSSNHLHLEVFIDYITKKEKVIIREVVLETDSESVCEFIEICAPIQYNPNYDKHKPTHHIPKKLGGFRTSIQRDFVPGSDWLYWKIYSSPRIADRILEEDLINAVNELYNKSLIDYWFFIRYADPEYHLRIRFKVKNTKNIGKIIEIFNGVIRPRVNSKEISLIQLDTYQRELERYGPNRIDLTEKIFWLDSEMIVKFLHFERAFKPDDIVWKFALLSIDSLLHCFRFSLEERISLLRRIRHGFYEEFGVGRSKVMKVSIDTKCRSLKAEVTRIISSTQIGNNQDTLFENIIKERVRLLWDLIDESRMRKSLIAMDESEKIDYYSSLIHMSLNRLFRTNQRESEMLICDLLYREYVSRLKRGMACIDYFSS